MLALIVASCGTPSVPDLARDSGVVSDSSIDAATTAIPRFSSTTHVDLGLVERISKFRSGIGHDFADAAEGCRSMKHYVCPRNCFGSNWPPPGSHDPPWTTIPVRSPANGIITRLESEQTFGAQLHIRPDGHDDFRIRIFHITPAADVIEGAPVEAGQVLGTHASDLTMSDIAVERFEPNGLRLISFFDTLSDEGFAMVQARGVSSREELQIARSERDAAPLSCTGGQFASSGTLENWVVLAE